MKTYQTDKIRNIALIGSSGSGKTTLAEAILLEGGVIERKGSVNAKNTVSDYNEIEQQIADRAHLFSLFSSPPESLTRPYVKSQLFSYFEAAETIGPQMVDFLVGDFLLQLRKEFETETYDSSDLIQAEFKEYILPYHRPI